MAEKVEVVVADRAKFFGGIGTAGIEAIEGTLEVSFRQRGIASFDQCEGEVVVGLGCIEVLISEQFAACIESHEVHFPCLFIVA